MRHVQRLAAFVITALACASASATIVAANTTYGVIDGREDTRALNVTTHGSILDLNIGIEFSKCDDPAIGPEGTRCLGAGAPFENEFDLELIAPSGQRVILVRHDDTYVAGPRGSGAGRVLVSFDDEAASAAGPRVQAGSFRPEEVLSAFDGMDMFGSWTLFLRDENPGDPLEFLSARLDVDFKAIPEPAPVPEPATLAMLGLGLGLMRMRTARRR